MYYFNNQYAWNLFPDQSREKVKQKLIGMAAKYRKKHPDKNLKVLFWPKAALSGFHGMNNYDPLFGESFFNDSFHNGILHEKILKNIKYLKNVSELIADCQIVRFDCGHGIHVENPKKFIECLITL